MNRLRRAGIWLAALAAVPALTGCVTLGLGNGTATSAAPSPTASAPAPSTATRPTSDDAPTANRPTGTGVPNSPTTPKNTPPPPDNLTAPGTELKFGQVATSVYESLGQVNNVEVTIVSVTKGQQADLAKFEIKDAALKQATPFYVVSQYKIIGGDPIKTPILDSRLAAADQNGSRVSSVTLFGSLPQCEGDRSRELKVGDTFKDCRVFMAPPGSDVVSVTWSGAYSAKPFVWKA